MNILIIILLLPFILYYGGFTLVLYGVSQQRELLIAYNVDFYKGIHDVSLEDIEHNVDKYLSNL